MRRSTKAKFRSDPERIQRAKARRAARVRSRCYFCEKETNPDYRDEAVLIRFLTKRGKIRPRNRSGLCAKHQRLISREIKRARGLGLLPYRVIG